MNRTKVGNSIKVGSVAHLENGGIGLLFKIMLVDHPEGMPPVPAFAIRFQDNIRIYKNVCGHIAVNLDFSPGHFFDEEGEHLICATHGAAYAPDSGKCLGGPCFGVGLEPLVGEEVDGVLYLKDQSVSQVIE